MAARVRTHLLFDMERNAMSDCSVMSNRRGAPPNASGALPHSTSFNLCGLNLRNENKTHVYGRTGSRITGGFGSSDFDTNFSLDSRRALRRHAAGVLRSDSERSDKIHLMNCDTSTEYSSEANKMKLDLWDDQARQPLRSEEKLTEKTSAVVRGRMYSRRKKEEQLQTGFSSSDCESIKLGALPKKKGGSTSTASNRSSMTSSASSDFFMIPKHLSERFVPLGNINLKQSAGPAVSMMEVSDPKLCIVLDMIEARDLPQLSLSPGSMKPYQQRALRDQMKCLKNVMTAVRDQTSASDAMLLMNMESNTLYPFLTYIVVDTQSTDSRNFSSKLDSILSNNIPQEEIHCLAGYEEVAIIAKAPLNLSILRKPSTNQTGYIISMFKIFAGEDSEKLERSWLMWTGARTIYKQIPEQLGLRKITFHKKRHSQAGGIVYVLICECLKLQDQVTIACDFVSNLRARCCGYTAIYRPIDIL